MVLAISESAKSGFRLGSSEDIVFLLISVVRVFSIWTSEVFTKKIFYTTWVISYSSIIAELSTWSAKAFSMLIYQFPKESDVTFFLKLEFIFVFAILYDLWISWPTFRYSFLFSYHSFYAFLHHHFNMFSYIVCI